ncbi:caspase family protein [Halorubrum sp. DTA98]|uniref:caspase family protein n=1 Tax=Halorubrum sp. DTA98 TaxID=3402163 RepID=UPI003AAF00A0
MSIDIEPLRDDDGISVTDHIENTQFKLYTDRPVDLRPGDEDDHYFPVDTSVRLDVEEVVVPRVASVIAHGADGQVVAEGSEMELDRSTYHLEVPSTPTKTYLRVDGGVSVATAAESTHIRIADRVSLAVGFRSFNEQPAGTITTPPDPNSMFEAVSCFGSALHTTSPERSFPTLRGHPPLLELGSELRIPEHVEPPDSGVRIVVPPEFRSLYPVVPLAYYLAAEIVPGSAPRLEGDGWEFPLEPDLERIAGQVLRQTFHLDCITRTEGFFQVDLHERATTDLDLDWGWLYELPIAGRLGKYLDVPFDRIEPELPQWTLTTDVRPDSENVEMLPFVAAELSLVRSPETVERHGDSESDGVSGFLRSRAPDRAGVLRGGADAASVDDSFRGTDSRASHAFMPDDVDLVRPEPVDTVEHAWIGHGVPIGANKATPDAYRRRLDVGSIEQSRISVTVVCNDEQMREEGNVADLYGLRDIVQFDIEVKYDLSRAEMRAVLESDVDFLHYIGHVDERGMQCADSFLDLTAESLDVGVSAFLLNACQSYEQGEALIHRGSRGGIVTLTDVANSPATRLGRIVARLMNGGFNLRTALYVAKQELITGQQYIVIGDGGTTVCQSRSGGALVVSLDRAGDDRWDIAVDMFPNGPYGNGSLGTLNTSTVDEHYYIPSKITASSVSSEDFSQFCALEMLPIFFEGELRWSDEFIVN